jgi:hypothetical protein
VTYTDGAGASQTLTFAHTFGVDSTAAKAVSDTLTELGTGAFDPVGSKTVFIGTMQGTTANVPAWAGFSTIPAAETEVGTEYRRQHDVTGAGRVRINANVKGVTGAPNIKIKYTLDGFAGVADLVTFVPPGTGLQPSGWVDLPSPAKADIGLTFYLADGAETASLDLYELEVEFKPALVTAFRDFSDDFSDDFS